jgi:hypothetical protein
VPLRVRDAQERSESTRNRCLSRVDLLCGVFFNVF